MKLKCRTESRVTVQTARPALISALLLGIGLSGWMSPLQAQEKATLKSVDSRLQRVERVLDKSLLDQLQRIDALQREIRELRGEIESLNYELATQKKRSTDLYNDTDGRITELEAGLGSVNPLTDETAGPLDETQGDSGEAGLSANAAAGSNEPQAIFVPENSAAGAANLDRLDFGDGPTPPRGPLRDTATQAEKASYTRAYDLLARGQNESAVAAFDEFLKQFPDGPYSDNAWYWQGEAMYAQRAFDEALRNFGVVVSAFPNSTKVPDARLKIGFALYEQKNYAKARGILSGVQDDYPGRSAAVLARKRLQQMDRENR